MGRERWFRGGREGRERPFDWYTLAKERDIPLEQARVLHEEALRRAREYQSLHRNAEAIYLDLLEEARQEAWRPSPGKVTRTMRLAAERAGKRPRRRPAAPGKRTLTSYLEPPARERLNANRERERLEAIADSFRAMGVAVPADLQSALARVQHAEPLGIAPGAESVASDAVSTAAPPAQERSGPGTAAYRRLQANLLAAHGHFEELDALEEDEPVSLPDDTRVRMERAFGHSFRDVRVHADSPRAAGSTHALTQSRDIHFARDRYAPGTAQGDWLIAHELAHVVQQTAAPGIEADKRILEAEADRAAGDAVAGRHSTVAYAATMGAAQAFADDEDHDTAVPEPDTPDLAAEQAEQRAEPAAAPAEPAEPAAELEDEVEDEEGDVDIHAELDQIAVESGGEGAGTAAAGGGGGAVPDMPEQAVPEVTQSKPEEALASLQGARPDRVAGAMGSVKTAASSDVSQTRTELAETPPQMKSTGESAEAGPARSEGRPEGAGEAQAGDSGEQQGETDAAAQAGIDEQGAPGDQEGEQAQSEAESAPAAPAPAVGTAQPPVQGEADGSLSEAEVARMGSAVDAIPTADFAAGTDAGEAPEVVLEGAADPARAAAPHGRLQTQIAQQDGQARTDSAQPMGEHDIRSTVPEEVLQAEVSAVRARAAVQAAAAGPALALDAGEMGSAAGIIARQEKGAEIDAALAEAQADMAAERQQNQQERTQREDQARLEIAALKQQSSAEENQARQQAQAEVESTRAEWQAEVDQQSAEARTKADSEVQKGLDEVETEQEQANQQARQHVAEGEQKAEAERQKGEREAEQEKSKAKEESGGFFGWAASAAKGFFEGIKKAVSAALEAARRAIRAVVEAAKKLATQVIERARQVIVAAIQAVGKALIAIGDALLAAFPALRDRFRGLMKGLVDRAVEAVNQIAEKLEEGVQKALDLLGKGLDAALGLLEKGLHAIVDVVGGVVQSAIAFAEGMVQAFAAFAVLVKDIAASPMAWLSALGASIMDGLQNHLWGALKTAVNEWLESKVVELLGIGGMVLQILLQGGIDLGAIAKMAWEGLQSAIPAALITILVEKLVSMIVPAAGAVMAILEGLQAAWGTLSRIVAAFGAFSAFLKAVKSGKAGPQFAQMLALAAVVVLDFVSNWLLRKLMSAARKIGRKLKAMAKRLAKKLENRGKGKQKPKKNKDKKDKDKDEDMDAARRAAKKGAAQGWQRAKAATGKQAMNKQAVEQTLKAAEGTQGGARVKLDADVQGKSWSVKASATAKGKSATASKGRGSVLKNKSGGTFLTSVDIQPVEKRVEAMTRKELARLEESGQSDLKSRLQRVEARGRRMLDGRLKGLTLKLTEAPGTGKDAQTKVAALIEPNYKEWEILVVGNGLEAIREAIAKYPRKSGGMYNEQLGFLEHLGVQHEAETMYFYERDRKNTLDTFPTKITVAYEKNKENLFVTMQRNGIQHDDKCALSDQTRSGKGTRPHDAVPASVWRDAIVTVGATFGSNRSHPVIQRMISVTQATDGLAVRDGRSNREVENAHGDLSALQRFDLSAETAGSAMVDSPRSSRPLPASHFRGKDWDSLGTRDKVDAAMRARVKLVIAQLKDEVVSDLLLLSVPENIRASKTIPGAGSFLEDPNRRADFFSDLEKEVLDLASREVSR